MEKNGEMHTNGASFLEDSQRISEWHRFWKVFLSRRVVIVGMVILAVAILAAIFAPLLAPYDPDVQNLSNILLQPCKDHLLGTDQYGRDTLSRLIYGARTAMTVGLVCVFLSSLIGTTLGAVSGYFGGVTSMVIMRVVDALMAFPMMLLAILFAAVFGGGIKNVVVALSIGAIPPYARVMDAQTLSIRENDYIKAQQAMGSGSARIILGHILPNAFPPILVQITVQLGALILAEAGLSFIGIGIKAPTAAWGSMVNDGYKFLTMVPMLSFAPGLAVMLVVFAFNIVGDGLRDALDPRLRGKL